MIDELLNISFGHKKPTMRVSLWSINKKTLIIALANPRVSSSSSPSHPPPGKLVARI
jgi:hypothetical protein